MGRRFEHLGLEVREDVKGRGLYCTRNFAQGETILNGEAALRVCLPDLWKNYCTDCFKSERENGSLRICTGCGMVAFCSSCWPNERWHKEECPILAHLLQACQGYARAQNNDQWQNLVCCALSISRLLRLLHGGQEPRSPAELATASLDDFAELCTPPEDISGDPEGFAALLVAEPLNSLFPAELRHSQDLATVICHCYEQLTCNSFLACSADETPVGQLCDPVAALLNHSCKPNAAMVWNIPVEGRTHSVKCIRALTAGEEVLISYVDPGRPWWIRQPTLKATYGFICDCAVCREISAWERRCGSRGLDIPPGIENSIAAVKAADGTILMMSAERTRGLCTFLHKEMGIAVQAAPDKDICRVADAATSLGKLTDTDGPPLTSQEAGCRLEQLGAAVQTLLQLLGPRHMLLRELVSVLRLAEIAEDWKTCMELAPAVLTSLAVPDGEMSARKADVLALLSIARLRTAGDDVSRMKAQAEAGQALEAMARLYGETLPSQIRFTTLQQLHRCHTAKTVNLDSMD
ncbi:ASHR1 [Symbiodinium natans]|uniref:ASHR1 protein n=1 Tax=Symbiodinium natans TaxID=878477 RepID=A0A812SD08_9DINO|nr:ASHR1 [Symbiodinium natans]